MASTIQVRVDDELKIKSDTLFKASPGMVNVIERVE